MFPSYVNQKQIMALRDSGCSCLVVQENLVIAEQYTKEVEIITLGDGSTISCKCAVTDIDTPSISGILKAAVMKECTAPLIIGYVPNIKPDNNMEIYQEWLRNKTNTENLETPMTLKEYNRNSIETLENNLNILRSNNTEPTEWIRNLNHVSLIEKVILEDKLVESDIIEKKFPNWNGTEEITQYITKFDTQCDKLKIPENVRSVMLTQHVKNQKTAFMVANKNIDHYESQKVELELKLKHKENKDSVKSKNSEVISCEKELEANISREQKKQMLGTVQNEQQTNYVKGSFDNITHKILEEEQKKDTQIKKLIKSSENPKTNNFGRFMIKNKILVRTTKDSIEKTETQQIVVPKALTQTIMSAGHKIPLAGHLGAEKTYNCLNRNIWWKTMKKDIKIFIQSCNECLRINTISSKKI